MSDIRVVGSTVPTRLTADGGFISPRGLRDGTLAVAPWLEALALEGRVFLANSGTVTTPITFGAGALVTTAPDLTQTVPVGTTVLPIEIRIYMEAYGTDAIFECLAATGTGGVVGSGGSAITPVSLRSDAPISNTTTIRGSDTSATYMTTNVAELFHEGARFAITKTASSATVSAFDQNLFVWRRSSLWGGPVLYGAAQLMVFAKSQAGAGFITYTYAQIPSNSVT